MNMFNPCTYSQIIPPPWYKVELIEPLPKGFDMLQYFETILLSLESLWSSLLDEVYFMGGCAAGGLWRHQKFFECLTCKITHKISTSHHFIHKLYFCCWKRLKTHSFSPKNGLTTCYLWRPDPISLEVMNGGAGGGGGGGVGGDSLVGFRLKFSDFVISRLKLSVVGKSQLVCKNVW